MYLDSYDKHILFQSALFQELRMFTVSGAMHVYCFRSYACLLFQELCMFTVSGCLLFQELVSGATVSGCLLFQELAACLLFY
jgi:hypothetical protein